MKALFLSELYRFRMSAIISFIVYALLLLVVNSNQGLLNIGGMQQATMLYLPSGCAFAFAIVQMSTYKNISRWTYLIHRPMKLTHVMASLWLTGFCLLSLIFVLPVTIVYVCTDIWQLAVFEARHYFWLLHIWGFLVNFYLMGFIASLYPSKITLSLLFTPIIWYSLDVFPEIGLFSHVLLFVMLLVLYKAVIKPDIQSTSMSMKKSLLFGFSLQAGLYVSLSIVFLFLTAIFLMSNNRNSGIEPSFYHSDSKDAFQVMLKQLPNDEASYLSSEIELANITRSSFRFDKPINNQTFDQPHYYDLSGGLYSPESKQEWSFNHSAKKFEQFNHSNDEKIVVIDQGSRSNTLDFVPIVRGRFIYDKASVWLFDSKELNLYNKFTLENNEFILPYFKETSSYLWLLTTKNIHMFLQADVNYNTEIMSPLITTKLPKGNINAHTMHVAEVSDGYLYLIIYADSSLDLSMMQRAESVAGNAYLIHAKFDGSSRLLSQYEIPNRASIWNLWSSYLVSPVYAYLEYELKTKPGMTSLNHYVPKQVWIFSSIFTLLIFIIAGALLRNTQLSLHKKIIWMLFSGIGGLPGIISCWLLTERKSDIKQSVNII
jgi:hypothetical protein